MAPMGTFLVPDILCITSILNCLVQNGFAGLGPLFESQGLCRQ